VEQPAFYQQAVTVMDMMDCVIGFLGPDLDPLIADLMDLGKRHQKYGVPKYMFGYMGEALIQVMKEYMGNEISEDEILSWRTILNFLFYHLVAGYSY
jgi:hemoglobin-like flavoprotein